MAVTRSLKNAVVTLTDLTGAQEFIITLETGDLNYNLPRPAQHVMDRNAPGVVQDGPHEDVTWSMSAFMQSLTADPSIANIVAGTSTSWGFGVMISGSEAGDYSAKQVSLQDGTTAVPFVQMRVAIADPGGGATETLYFLNSVISLSGQEGMPNTLNMSGICMGYSTDDFLANVA